MLLSALMSVADSRREEQDSLLRFLYRYMPTPDKAMYGDDFWLTNISSSLQARELMPWGSSVPEREWCHFVLPVRVNNENLDLSRPAFFNALKDRVKGLGMKEAILEVNHWCHEKVTYRPSDARTSSPMSSVSQAIGRCGEESTFTVAALRSVGIPARQVYTPRWAHTDDNHAWVEAWADGQWYFLGACEPEPILNLAWFNQPASRGMMMHTSVFGDYRGPEEMIDRNDNYTVINVTENYAPTVETTIEVRDKDGNPVPDATVKFMVYNYSEYYPIATKHTGANGRASLRTGKGDMIVWCSKGDRLGISHVKATAESPVRITLTQFSEGMHDFDIVPPGVSATLPQASTTQIASNNCRLAHEDSLRNAYVSTFCDSITAVALAQKTKLPEDEVIKVLTESRGNHHMIRQWLDSLSQQQAPLDRAMSLLLAISEKDRRDVSRQVLDDSFLHTPAANKDFADRYVDYVLNPRVENEGLTPYKQFFGSQFTKHQIAGYHSNPQTWIKDFRTHIRKCDYGNPKQLRMSPEATWRSGEADALNASICLVSGLRSFGVPARIDPVTGKTQYGSPQGGWIDVNLYEEDAPSAPSAHKGAMVKASRTESPVVSDPRYYSHFSLSQIGDDMFPRQMEYPEGMTLSQWLADTPRLDVGRYILTTGQRLADGTVLARSYLFAVSENQDTISLPFIFRSDTTRLQVIGSLDAETRYTTLAGEEKSLLSTAGRGYYAVGIIAPNHEPSAHVLNEIAALSTTFATLDRQLIFLFRTVEDAMRFDTSSLRLPTNVHFGIDTGGAVERQLTESLNLSTPTQLPVMVVADSFGRVIRLWEGYTIGIPDALLRIF